MTTTELHPGFVAVSAEEIAARPWAPFGGMKHVQVKYLRTSPHAVSGLMRLEPGAAEVRHVHVGGQHEVWVVEGTVEMDGAPMPAGSYLHVVEGMTHGLRNAGDGDCLLFFVFTRMG